jgi:TRAP-type mannitol/chloroaromatic compound transport system substrate-binding protein
VPVLFKYYGLDKIWAEAYGEVKNVEWLSAGAWDPLHIFTKKPIRKLADMKGQRVFGVPTAGKFLSRYGLVPVTLPWDDIEVAIQTGELDGVAWCGFTEAYEVGWADVCNYALLNNVTGAWFGSYFANSKSWAKVPPHLQELFLLSVDSSHYYRQVWYWGGEAKLRVEGKKMELTTIPANEWDQVVKDAEEFWDEVSASSPRAAKVVDIFKQYSRVMEKVGVPYRYS